MSGSVYYHEDTLAAFYGKARVSEKSSVKILFRMHSIESNNF